MASVIWEEFASALEAGDLKYFIQIAKELRPTLKVGESWKDVAEDDLGDCRVFIQATLPQFGAGEMVLFRAVVSAKRRPFEYHTAQDFFWTERYEGRRVHIPLFMGDRNVAVRFQSAALFDRFPLEQIESGTIDAS